MVGCIQWENTTDVMRQKKGRVFYMEGSLGEDVFKQDNYLINAVPVMMTLKRAPDEFILMSDSKEKGFRLEVLKIEVRVPVVEVGPAIVTAHDAALHKGGMAQYFFRQGDIVTHSIPKSSTSFEVDIRHGVIPQRMAVVFVETKRMIGQYDKNPFQFDHLLLQTIRLQVNDRTIPSQDICYDFANRSFVPALCALYDVNSNIIINHETFDGGYSIFVFDINRAEENDDRLKLQESGYARLEVTFAENLPNNYTAIIYSEYQSVIQIDHVRKVHFTSA